LDQFQPVKSLPNGLFSTLKQNKLADFYSSRLEANSSFFCPSFPMGINHRIGWLHMVRSHLTMAEISVLQSGIHGLIGKIIQLLLEKRLGDF